MHDHDNNKDGGMKSMTWMMIICCAVPLVFILLFGAGGRAVRAPSWIIFGAIAVMIIAHFVMMGKSKKHSDEDRHAMADADKDKDSKNDKSHSGHGRCH